MVSCYIVAGRGLVSEWGYGPNSMTLRATTTNQRYYGWVIAWTSFGVLTVAYGIPFCFGVVLPYLERDLGISRRQGTLAFALYVFVYSAMSGVSGWLTDRRGPRFVLTLGAIFLGAGYALMAAAQSPAQLTVALGLVAGLGMSAAFVPCSATVVRWFVHRRGRALSIATSGSSFAAVTVPLAMGGLVGRFGWRSLYLTGALVVFVALMVGARLMVRDPESKGLSIDHELDGVPAPNGPIVVDAKSLDVRAAARTLDFWLIVGVYLFTWLVIFVPLVHLSPYARDAGASSTVGATLVSLMGVGGLAGRGAAGNVSDRLGRLPTLAAMLVSQVGGFIAFASTQSLVVLMPAAALFGLGYGGCVVLFPAIAGDRFGRAYAGGIVGAVFAGAGSLGAIGPYAAAWIYDSTNSYRWAFLLSAAANVVAIGFVVMLWISMRRSDHPRRRVGSLAIVGGAGGARHPRASQPSSR